MILKLSGTCYAVRSLVHISNINTFKSVYYAYYVYYKIWNNSLGNSSNSGKIFALQNKILELWLVHNPEPLTEVYLNN